MLRAGLFIIKLYANLFLYLMSKGRRTGWLRCVVRRAAVRVSILLSFSRNGRVIAKAKTNKVSGEDEEGRSGPSMCNGK